MEIIIEKGILINKLLWNKNCEYLNEELKSYLFIDYVQARARFLKKRLITHMKIGLRYTIEGNHWCLSFMYNVQLQCCSCLDCGGYEMIGRSDVYVNAAPRCFCSCPGFQEIYQQNINILNAPLEIYM